MYWCQSDSRFLLCYVIFNQHGYHSSLPLFLFQCLPLSRSLTQIQMRTVSPLLGKAQIWFLALVSSFTLSLSQALCLARIKTRLIRCYTIPLQSGEQHLCVKF